MMAMDHGCHHRYGYLVMVCGRCPGPGTIYMRSSAKSYLTPHSSNFGSGACCLLINAHDFVDIAE